LNQVPVVFSEDFLHGAYFEGVGLANPFAGNVAISDLG